MEAQDAISQPRGRPARRLQGPLRLGVTLALLLLLAGVAPAGSSAADRVLVHTPNGDRTFTDSDFAQPDVVDETYVLRSSTNQEDQTVSQGTSVAKLLEEGGIAPTSGFLRVTRSDGTWTTLTADDLKDPPPFQNGLKPVVFLDGDRVRYLRPVRDDSDVNADDYITTTDPGQPLELWLQTGNILSVQGSASTNAAAAGAPVTYTAGPISGGRDGEQFTVTWKFDDGSTATGASVTHAFSTQGSYGAIATAQGDQGSGGASNQVIVQVGQPPQTGTGPGAGTTSTPIGPATGETGKGQGGTGTGSPKHASGSGGETGAAGTPVPQQSSTGSAAAQPTATTGTAPSTATTPAHAPAKTPRRRRSTRPGPPSAPVVRGVLVSATSPARNGATAQRSGRRRISKPGGDAPAIPLTAIAVVLVLGLGVWHERRAVRRGTVAPA